MLLPSPGFPQLSGTVGKRAPHPPQWNTISSFPRSALNTARLTPAPHPALPTLDRKEVMHLLLLIIYLFGDRNDVKVYLEISISIYF